MTALFPPKAAAAPTAPLEAAVEEAPAAELDAPLAAEVIEVERLREEAMEDSAAATDEEGTAVLLLTVAVPSAVCETGGGRRSKASRMGQSGSVSWPGNLLYSWYSISSISVLHVHSRSRP